MAIHECRCYRFNVQMEYFVSPISLLPSIGSFQFVCLPHIIMGGTVGGRHQNWGWVPPNFFVTPNLNLFVARTCAHEDTMCTSYIISPDTYNPVRGTYKPHKRYKSPALRSNPPLQRSTPWPFSMWSPPGS
jgi:hypothetical protein